MGEAILLEKHFEEIKFSSKKDSFEEILKALNIKLEMRLFFIKIRDKRIEFHT